MIFILGMLSLVQVLFLPGAVILKFFKIRKGIIQSAVFIFALSLTFNFLWVLLLNLLHINFPIIHYILFVAELGLLIYLSKDSLPTSLDEFSANLFERLNKTIDDFKLIFAGDAEESAFSKIIRTLVTVIFFAWAISGLMWLVKLAIGNFGTAFNLWDAVLSWNGWATGWFRGVIPNPNRYPQLIPANFSITYSFLQSTDIQIFAKGFMPLFTIFTWLMFFDLAFDYKKPGIFIGAVVLRYMTKKFLYTYIAEGYVDVALLFFSFLIVYTLLKARKADGDKSKISYLYLGGFLAAGATLTKQNGLLMFIFYPLLAFLLVTDEMELETFWERVKILIKPTLLGFAILLPWYLLNEYNILIGINNTNVDSLVSANRHSGRSAIERFMRSFEILEKYAYLFPFVILTLPLIPKKFRQISLITIFPFTIIWAFLFSIFPRNLAMVFPYLALAAGLGAEGLMNFVLKIFEKIKLHRSSILIWIFVIIIAIASLSLYFNDQKLTDLQIASQKEALLYNINHKLYDYFDEVGGFGTVMTYYPIKVLPGFEDFYLRDQFKIYKETYESFAAHPEVEYLLVWEWHAGQEVLDYISLFEEIGALEYYFEDYDMRFYKVLDRDAILEYAP